MSDEKVERWTIWNEHHPEEATVDGPYASGIKVVPATALARVEQQAKDWETSARQAMELEGMALARAEKAEAELAEAEKALAVMKGQRSALDKELKIRMNMVGLAEAQRDEARELVHALSEGMRAVAERDPHHPDTPALLELIDLLDKKEGN